MPETAPLLELRNVSVMRGNTLALDRLSLTIASGEHAAILGPNGCGKSTLVKVVSRECYPLLRDGSVLRIMGQEVWDVFQLRSCLGIVSHDLMATCTREITGREVVLSGFFSSIGIWPHQQITPEMQARVDSILDRLEISHLAGREMTEMSSGEGRRILIARALVHNPKALLLDEPSTSLDLHAQQELSRFLSKLAASGVAVLLVTHHLADIVPEIERVILMKFGRVAADGPKEQMLIPERLSEVFGCEVEISRRDGYYHAW